MPDGAKLGDDDRGLESDNSPVSDRASARSPDLKGLGNGFVGYAEYFFGFATQNNVGSKANVFSSIFIS